MASEPTSGFGERVRRGLAYRGKRGLTSLDRAGRRATARWRLRPTFLILGAQKAGTSSLHGYLTEHPAVRTARAKEVQYFTKYYARGAGWYRAQFPLARRHGFAVGEATAACLYDPRSPERVFAFDPKLLLVVLLRDPVERAYSHFQMERRWGRETGTFEQALDAEERELPGVLELIRREPLAEPPDGFARTYVARGRYAEQLERWLRLFDRAQLLILMSDELDADPAATMAKVTRFLEIPEHETTRFPRRGVQEYGPMEPAARARLERAFAEPDRHLADLLGRDLPWTAQRQRAGSAR
jgi:hypothetical protein